MLIRTVDLSSITPYANNPRKNDKAVAPVAKSISEFGFQQPIVVDKDMVIIVGHTRYLAAKQLELTQVPVLVSDNLSADQVKAYRIADNRTNQNAVWDNDLLTQEILQLQGNTYDLLQTAFTQMEIDQLLSTDEEMIPNSLREMFIVPPYSVIHGDNPIWLHRKRDWTDGLRLASGESRENVKVLPSEMKSGKGVEKPKSDGVSIFDPALAEVIIAWFSAPGDKIIDNFSGGSVRGAVSAAMGRKYTGIDIRPAQIAANKKWYQANKHRMIELENNEPEWIVGDGTKPAISAPGEYDFAFTCPPYGDLEVYSDMDDDISNKSYVDFKEAYRNAAKELYTVLKDNTFAAIVVGEFRNDKGSYQNFVNDTIDAYLDAGFEYYNEIIYVTPGGTLRLRAGRPMRASRKVGKSHQNLLVFGKNLGKTLVKPVHQNLLVFTKGDVKKSNAIVKNIFTNVGSVNDDDTAMEEFFDLGNDDE